MMSLLWNPYRVVRDAPENKTKSKHRLSEQGIYRQTKGFHILGSWKPVFGLFRTYL
jgi:hypothetical protein